MPFQPQISWQVPQIMADFNADMERQAERRKQDAAAGKASKALLKALSGETGMDPTMIEGLSYQDAAAQLSAVVGKQHYQKGAEDLADALARRELTQTQIAEAPTRQKILDVNLRNALAAESNTAAFPKFASDVGRYAQPGELPYNIPPEEFERYALPEGETRPNLREVLASAGRTGYNPGANNLDDLVRAFNPAHGQAPPFFTADQFGRAFAITTSEGKAIPGSYSTVTGPHQSQIVIDPSAGLQTQEITDAQGNVYTVLVPPRGAPTFTPRTPQDRGAITPLSRLNDISRQLTALLPLSSLGQNAETIKKLQAEREALLHDMLQEGKKPGTAPARSAADRIMDVRRALDAGLPTATNPKTGKRVIFKDGQWQPLP